MKKLFPLLLFAFTALYAQAQIPGIVAQQSIGSIIQQGSTDIYPTSDGGFAISGREFSFAKGWVFKVDANFNLVWSRKFGYIGEDETMYSITQISSGDYFTAGVAYNYAINPTIYVPNNHGGAEDAYVVKLNAAGAVVWESGFGTPDRDGAKSVCRTDNDGGVAVAGYFGATGQYNTGGDAWVGKLDASGNTLWSRTYGGTGTDRFNSITQTADMGFLACGMTNSNDGDVSGNHGGTDAWVVKLDASGNIEWQLCVGGTGNEEANDGIHISGDANVICGYTIPANGNYQSYDGFVAKIGLNGTLNWFRVFGGSLEDRLHSISKRTNGGYITGGYSLSSDGDVGCFKGFADAWLLNLDSDGNLLWAKDFGSTYHDFLSAVIETAPDEYVFTGQNGLANNDVNFTNGNGDAWLVKVAPVQINVNINQTGGCGSTATLTASTIANHCFTFLWNTGETTASITVNTEQEYCVTVTEGNGFSNVACFTPDLNRAPQPSFSWQQTGDNCYRLRFTPSVINGTAPFTYQWGFPGAAPVASTSTSPSITYQDMGFYTAYLTVTDANGCTGTYSNEFIVGQPCLLSTVNFCHSVTQMTNGFRVNISGVESDCNGTAQIQYSYNGGATWTGTSSREFNAEGTYNICVKVRCTVCGVMCEQICCKNITIDKPCAFPTTVGLGINVSNANQVTFSAGALSPVAAGYDWDFNGDGVYDLTTAGGSTTQTIAPGTYTACVRIRRTESCYKVACRDFVVNPPCNVTARMKASICTGNPQDVLLEATNLNNVGYVTWLIEENPNVLINGLSANHIFSQPGVYYVTMRAYGAAEGCFVQSRYRINVEAKYCAQPFARPDGPDETMVEITSEEVGQGMGDGVKAMKLYPNPATQKATLAFSLETDQEVGVQILDLNGHAVWSDKNFFLAGDNQVILSTGDLASGVYLVRLTNSLGIFTEKLAIQK